MQMIIRHLFGRRSNLVNVGSFFLHNNPVNDRRDKEKGEGLTGYVVVLSVEGQRHSGAGPSDARFEPTNYPTSGCRRRDEARQDGY